MKKLTKKEMTALRAKTKADEYLRLREELGEWVVDQREAHAEARDIVYGKRSHEALWKIVKKLPSDFEPWGKREREGGDCSCGCRFFIPLERHGADWGVCVNAKSPRSGALTFEHQGCAEFQILKIGRKART